MHRYERFFRLTLLIAGLTASQTQIARAADGFDNNYIGGDANQLFATISGVNQGILFGPGSMSGGGGFYIPIPNGTTYNQGTITSFLITGADSYLRSAYLDRVTSTTLYYRVYASGGTPGAWLTLNLSPLNVLVPGTCYTATQDNFWSASGQSINVVQGLANGDYVLEFYMRSELYDVGFEPPNSCVVNADELCLMPVDHPGRYISSRFNTTDPMGCDIEDVIAGQSPPTKISFQLTGSLPLELTYFRGELRDKNVQLDWGTAQETNLETFEIERSDDGYRWLSLTEVTAAGNTTSNRDYAFFDKQPLTGANYYRLKALSSDGQVDISPVVVVVVNGANAVRVWPNPVRETLYYSLGESTTEERLTLRIINTSGQTVAEKTNDGEPLASISLADLQEGLYFLELRNQLGHRISLSRFIKTW